MNIRIGSAGLVIAALCLVARPVHAQESMRVECPLDDARRTITNALPEGWWTTPFVNDLSETRVQEIGGRRALMCVYGGSGSIQRYEPEGYTCTAVTGGFDCRRGIRQLPRPMPLNPETYSTGQVELRQTYMVDLDEGRAGGRDGADLWFEAETRDRLYLSPQNGAQIWVGDRSNRNYGGCARGSFSESRVPLSAVPVGSYVCVHTDQGRISQFRMNAISSGSPKTLTLGYTTWNR